MEETIAVDEICSAMLSDPENESYQKHMCRVLDVKWAFLHLYPGICFPICEGLVQCIEEHETSYFAVPEWVPCHDLFETQNTPATHSPYLLLENMITTPLPFFLKKEEWYTKNRFIGFYHWVRAFHKAKVSHLKTGQCKVAETNPNACLCAGDAREFDDDQYLNFDFDREAYWWMTRKVARQSNKFYKAFITDLLEEMTGI